MKSTWKRHPLRTLLVVMLVSFLLLMMLLSFRAYAVNGTFVVQETNNGCNPCSSTTVSVSFTSAVSAGDIVVVGVTSQYASPSYLTDSLGSSFTQLANVSNAGFEYSSIFYAILSTAGSDTVSANFVGIPSQTTVYIFEISGASSVSPAIASGTGTSSSVSTSSSAAFQPGAFLFAVTSSQTTSTAGGGFIQVSSANPNGSAAEYATGGVQSPTDFPSTLSVSTLWSEVGVAFEPGPTTTSSSNQQTSTTTTTVTSFYTLTSTETSTSVSTTTVTSVAPPGSVVTVTSTVTQSQGTTTLTMTKGQNQTQPLSILVYAYGARGTPIVGDKVTLNNSSGYSAVATTNSSGEAFFVGLSESNMYNVSATVNGVSLSAPVSLSHGSAVVVLEPSNQESTGSVSTSSSSHSTGPGNIASPFSPSVIIVMAIVITVLGSTSLFLMIRRAR